MSGEMSFMRARYYSFKMSDGSYEMLTIDQAREHDDPAIPERLQELGYNLRNKRRKKDGFEPGIQPNTGKYAGGRLEYEKQLKEMGLVEIGYDYVPTESVVDSNPCANEDFVKSCLEENVELSGNEIEAIKSGEYFED